MKEQARARARQLAQEFTQRGDAMGWFEKLYSQAQGFEDYFDQEKPPVRRFRVEYQRASADES
jgi:hypothetical protein